MRLFRPKQRLEGHAVALEVAGQRYDVPLRRGQPRHPVRNLLGA